MKQSLYRLLLIPLLLYTYLDSFAIEIDGINYVLNNSSNTASVSNSWKKYEGDIVIPSEIVYDDIKYNVTSINKSAFSECDNLTSVTIPNSVTSIGNTAFWACHNLKNVTLSNSIKTIEDETFMWCSSLTSVTIPDSVTSIGQNAFNHCI